MKITLYESFVRCHILYGITASAALKPLERLLAKIWSKIGGRRMHTLNRLNKFGLLKFKDELKLQECKLVWVWKWEKNKSPAPPSLKNIIVEKQDNLRGRHFNFIRAWKDGSVAKRIATRTNNEMNHLSTFNTKSTLVKNLKKKIIFSYLFNCRQRNCYICGNRANGRN